MDLVEDEISGIKDSMTAFMSQISTFMDSMKGKANPTLLAPQVVPPVAKPPV